jgi:hypothetical protein
MHDTADTARLVGYARERLEAALAALADGSDTELLGEAEQAVMAVHLLCGNTDPITLTPADVAEHMDRRDPACICPPALLARGGFRGGCPVHNPN